MKHTAERWYGGCRPGHKAIKSGESPVIVKNAWPALIEEEVFKVVQERLASNAPRVSHPQTIPSFYLPSGFLFCSRGRAMTGRSAKSHQYYYYTCNRSFKEGKEACNSRMSPKEKLESLIIDQIRDNVLVDERLEELVELVNEALDSAHTVLQDNMDAIDAEIADVKA